MKIILTAMQFAVWLADYQELCTTQAEALQDRNLPIVVEQLTGEGAFAVPTGQAGYLCKVYDITTCLALQAPQRLRGWVSIITCFLL